MGHSLRFAIDAAAAAILGAAVCFAVASLFEAPLIVAGSIGALVFVRVFASLVRLPAVVLSIDRFEPAPLIFVGEPAEMPRTNQTLPDATEQLREALVQLRRAVR